MSYYQNLALRSIKDGATIGAYTGGAATGVGAIGAIYHFAPFALGVTAIGGPEAIAAAHIGVFIAGAVPGALAGAAVGSIALSPFIMAFHAMTQQRIADTSIKTTAERLTLLKAMPDQVMEVVINEIIARYAKSKSLSASSSSKELLNKLQEYSHGLSKLELLENYLNTKKNKVLVNNGKKLFRIINETLTQLKFDEIAKYVSADKTQPNDAALKCPIGGKRKLIEEPIAVFCVGTKNTELHKVMVVDKQNFDSKVDKTTRTCKFNIAGQLSRPKFSEK